MDHRLLRVNQDGVLSIPASMWWCVLFLLRHSILVAFVLVTAMDGAGSSNWAYSFISWPAVLCEAPMWLLMVASARRLPQAGSGVRWLWRHGRETIVLAAALNLGWATCVLWDREVWNPWPERFMLIVALIELFVIAAVWRSALYRQLFSEFPSVPEAEARDGEPQH